MTRSPDRQVAVGRIVGLFGVRGWIKVYSYTRPREAILNYSPWLIESNGGSRQLQVLEGRMHGKGLVARVEGCSDRDSAAGLVGAEIAAFISQFPPISESEYYWAELEGLKVVNLAGMELGRVSHLFETGANDVMVVRGERERLIPLGVGIIKDVDRGLGIIRVDWDAED